MRGQLGFGVAASLRRGWFRRGFFGCDGFYGLSGTGSGMQCGGACARGGRWPSATSRSRRWNGCDLVGRFGGCRRSSQLMSRAWAPRRHAVWGARKSLGIFVQEVFRPRLEPRVATSSTRTWTGRPLAIGELSRLPQKTERRQSPMGCRCQGQFYAAPLRGVPRRSAWEQLSELSKGLLGRQELFRLSATAAHRVVALLLAGLRQSKYSVGGQHRRESERKGRVPRWTPAAWVGGYRAREWRLAPLHPE